MKVLEDIRVFEIWLREGDVKEICDTKPVLLKGKKNVIIKEYTEIEKSDRIRNWSHRCRDFRGSYRNAKSS